MKVLHVIFSGRFGGASIAALRLHQALQKNGMESEVFCMRDAPALDGVYEASVLRRKINSAENIVIEKLKHLFRLPDMRSYNLFASGLAAKLNRSDADIIHLHWINREMMSIAELSRIQKPVVWTLHDVWPFCGAEHYAIGTRYLTGYQKSEVSGQRAEGESQKADNEFLKVQGLKPNAFLDLDRWTFRRKQKRWTNWRPALVSPSHWMADRSRESALFKNRDVAVIPNCLDLAVFTPGDKTKARRALGLPEDKNLVLFGAFSPLDNRKGGDLLEAALEKTTIENTELVVFGSKSDRQVAGLPTHWMGQISGDPALAQLYTAVDLFAAPSRQDNLPNTIAEALSCGTPVVAFNIGGIPDMVKHQENGYLAEPYDSADLAHGIEQILNQKGQPAYEELCCSARRQAEAMFGENVVMAHRDVYGKMLEGQNE